MKEKGRKQKGGGVKARIKNIKKKKKGRRTRGKAHRVE
jgi:hypothetical protein